MIPPPSRGDLPLLRVKRGQTIRIHLAFVPRDAHLTVFRASTMKHYVLRPVRVLVWRVQRAGIVSVDLHGPGGSASYLVRLSR